MSTEQEPDAPQPDEPAPIDDPKASRTDLVVPILVFILLVLGIGRTVHQGSGANPAPDPGLGEVVSETAAQSESRR